jgi:hypothetical protein
VALGILLVLGKSVAMANLTVATVITDKLGNGAFELQVDPSADPKLVADQLKSNLQLPQGVELKGPITVDDKGIAHASITGAKPESTVEVALPNDVAEATGVGTNPAVEHRRRGLYWTAGAGAAGGIAAGILLPGGGGGNKGTPTEPLSPVQ